jgi:hypothetical protein
MPDATYDVAISDPVVKLNFKSIVIDAGPPLACTVTFIQERQSGAPGEPISVSLSGPRAQSFLVAWAQTTPIRKMIADLRLGGELPGITET